MSNFPLILFMFGAFVSYLEQFFFWNIFQTVHKPPFLNRTVPLTRIGGCSFNPFPHNNTFWCPWETSLLKTLWEKEKLLIASNFSFSHSVFSSPEHGVLSELLWSLTVRQCPSVRPTYIWPSIHNLLVNTLASTNINQSSPNLDKMYMTTRARMLSIMELIGPELSVLSALELENLPYLTLFIL